MAWSEAVDGWARGRWWQWRVPLLCLLAWDAKRHLADPGAGGLFSGITFGTHELGHLLFAPFGEVLTVAGGSINQLLIPVLTGLLFVYYTDYFGIAVAGTWLASSLLDLARYIGDARSLDLDLVGFGENSIHDWAWLLGHFRILQYDTRIAAFTRGVAVLVLLCSLGLGVWLCVRMWALPRDSGGEGAPS